MNIIRDAMTEWETNTCVRFVKKTNQEDYVEFMKLEGYAVKNPRCSIAPVIIYAYFKI